MGAFILVVMSCAEAQEKNEIGLVIGAALTPTPRLEPGAPPLPLNPGLTLGGEYDRRALAGRRAALYFGADLLASPLDVKLGNPPAGAIRQYAFFFATPHVRLKFRPGDAFSPWLSFGGGYADFLEKSPVGDTSFRPGTHRGTFEFGAGVDTQPIFHVLKIPIGLRAEVRDFYSGLPNYNQPTLDSWQHNVLCTGGLLIKF